MNVPLSVGPECYDTDHAGVECLVYDIIVNPKVIQDSASDETGQYRDFLCHLSIQSVEQKYPNKGLLDKQYKLPKLAYMGAVIRSQHIRDKKTIPGIHDLSETISRESNVNKIIHKAVEKIPTHVEKDLSYSLYWIKRGKSSDKDMKNRESIEEPSSSSSSSSAEHSAEHSTEHSEYEVPFKDTNSLYGLSYIEPTMIPDSDVLRLTLRIHFTENIDVENLEVKVSPYNFQVRLSYVTINA